MRRKNIIKHLRDVANVARTMQDLSIKNNGTGEVIDFDNDMAKHLICATLAYSAVVIAGSLRPADPEDALLSIITSASKL